MQVFLAEGVDGVDDAPVLLQAGVLVECPVPFGFCDSGDGEEEGAEGCDEEGEAGDADHCCGCVVLLCRGCL